MESLDEISKTSHGKTGFFKHVFNFNEDSKSEMLNIIQYSVLALIPLVILNKSMQKYVPEANDEKGSVEILAEIISQIIVMFLAILIIHRIITYIPTYSGEKYAGFSVTNIILAVLLIVLSLQTKLGEKVSILVERIFELWDGKSDEKKKGNNKGGKGGNNGNGNVKVSQPISQNQSMNTNTNNNNYNNNHNNHNNNNYSEQGTTSINSLPPMQTQQMPDYNNMYQNDSTPLIGAASPGMDSFGPMAANDMLGNAFGSSLNW
jgi:hypothetical protein